ncbi:hypothetical protein ACX0HA_16815 [Flavobacterium hauense]
MHTRKRNLHKKNKPDKERQNINNPLMGKDKDLRKGFYRRLLYIVMASIPLILLANEKGPARFLALAAFLFIMIQLISIIGFAQLYVDEFFPPKLLREYVTMPFDKFMYRLSAVMFPLGMFTLLFEMNRIDRTIGGMSLFFNWAFIGVGLALALIIILHIVRPSVYHESKRRMTIYAGFLFGWFLLFPSVASFINHAFAVDTIICKSYFIVRKDTGSKGTMFMFLKTDADDKERFDISKELYDKISGGGWITLCTKEGKLGYKVVTKFRK